MPSLLSITYKPIDETSAGHTEKGYVRHALGEANLIVGYGLENDRKGGNPKRNLNVMDDIALAELAAEGYPTTPGSLGENMIIAGLDLRTLNGGTRLLIGPEAMIEFIKLRDGCEQLTTLDGRLPDGAERRIGAMCRVLRGGRICVGDTVTVVTPEP